MFERCTGGVWLVGSEKLPVEAGQDLGLEGPARDAILGDQLVEEGADAALDFRILRRGGDEPDATVENLFETEPIQFAVEAETTRVGVGHRSLQMRDSSIAINVIVTPEVCLRLVTALPPGVEIEVFVRPGEGLDDLRAAWTHPGWYERAVAWIERARAH